MIVLVLHSFAQTAFTSMMVVFVFIMASVVTSVQLVVKCRLIQNL